MSTFSVATGGNSETDSVVRRIIGDKGQASGGSITTARV